MTFTGRYSEDVSAPTRGEAWRDVSRRTLLPAAGLWAAISATGFLITGPLEDLPAEDAVNEALVETRTPVLDTLTQLWSNIGGTHFLIIAGLLTMGLIWWRTRRWWFAVVPGLALAVQSAVFVAASSLVGRSRPDVDQLDHAPPTSSFPSGHTGASTAFYLTLALLAQRISNPALRWAATTLCFLVPALVAYSRLYRGMHQPSDVIVGVLNGIVCCWLAWRYLRRDDAHPAAAADRTADARPAERA
jgi:membrane-associated phospholipid phosphatase